MEFYRYPAFCDTHMHLVEYGKYLSMVDLRHAGSIAEMQKLLSRVKDPVINAFGWNQEQFTEHRFPCATDLDAIAMDRPVLLSRICGHVTAVNSYVLRDLGIARGGVPLIEGGHIDVDAEGNPTGIFRERARVLLKDQGYYDGTPEAVVDHILVAQADLLSKGIVEVHSDDLTCYPNLTKDDILEVFAKMAETGQLKLRVIAQAQGEPEFVAAARDQLLKRLGPDADFQIGSLKLFTDGSLGARTAHLLEPYADQPDTSGIAIYTQSDLEAIAKRAFDCRLPLTVHAIGDGAIAGVLTALEVLAQHGADADYLSACGIVHCQIVNPELLKRMAALGARAYIQPIFLHEDAVMVHSRLGEARAAQSYAFKTMHDMGIPLYLGSDAPIDTPDVIKGLYCAIKRQTLHEPPLVYRPEEALPLDVALAGYTRTSSKSGATQTSGPARYVILSAPLEDCIEKPRDQWVVGVE